MRNLMIVEKVVKLGRRIFISVEVNDVYTAYHDYSHLCTNGSVGRSLYRVVAASSAIIHCKAGPA